MTTVVKLDSGIVEKFPDCHAIYYDDMHELVIHEKDGSVVRVYFEKVRKVTMNFVSDGEGSW